MIKAIIALPLAIFSVTPALASITWNIHVRDFRQHTVDSYVGCSIGFGNIEPGPGDANFLYAGCIGVDQNDMPRWQRPEGPPTLLFEEIGIAWNEGRYYEGLSCKFIWQRIENYGTHSVGSMMIECGWQDYLFVDGFEPTS